MARTVTAREAEEHVADLLASAEAGEETLILKHGKPVARLVPVPAGECRADAGRAHGRIRGNGCRNRGAEGSRRGLVEPCPGELGFAGARLAFQPGRTL
ncbi:type II toxin-antitoxin system prevent-host-death family antitoxin [Aerophototrophica crusticola]|uniref:Antitoxin n=1 Tax=Aerophototrophica crusticola TaxID=1709002 RepID=A0A858R7X3_9PROT|nr:type II toxin-antitoxin system prevent-host-death family antitoxin [Rhodospirillaceae bacterium B3]